MDLGANSTQLLIEYRYWILIPLSLLEGPIVAFAAGTLAAAGYFNPYVLEVLFICRDLLTDLFYYYVGMFARTTRIVQWFLKKIGVTAEHLGKAQALWEHRPFSTMFLGKLSYGVAPSFFIVAGMVKMSLKKFIGYNASIASVQYGICLILGYEFGAVLGASFVALLDKIQIVIGALVIAFAVAYVIRHYGRKLLLREESKQSD